MGKKSIDRLEREEKDLYDIIGRIKGIHGHYLTERTYESIRNLALAGRAIMDDCCQIMQSYDREDVHIDVQNILRY